MEPAAKKRRLAPKVEAQASPPTAHHVYESPAAAVPPPLAHDAIPPPPPERLEFESFARHLQDAAMFICRQTQKPTHTSVSVLMVRWDGEGTETPEADTDTLEHLLRERYGYTIHRYNITSCARASLKLGVRIRSFLESQGPEHLLIVYYAGRSVLGTDNELYWTSDARDDAARIKWKGLRCLFEESSSDILFLFDTFASYDEPFQHGSGVQDVLASGSIENISRARMAHTFTIQLADAFYRLAGERTFTAEHLFHDIVMQRRHERSHTTSMSNGTDKLDFQRSQLPLLYKLATGTRRSLTLTPLPRPDAASQSRPVADITTTTTTTTDDAVISSSLVNDLTFDEQRVLVCTTYVGEASPNMSSFTNWLKSRVDDVSTITAEGMFLGPPTMLLISMPMSVWNVVQHDKVCCYLGYVSSHNMTHLYHRLISSPSIRAAIAGNANTVQESLETHTPVRTTSFKPQCVTNVDTIHGLPETPIRSEERPEAHSLPRSSQPQRPLHTHSSSRPSKSSRPDPEDSAEMKAAAEQLSALSHVRHLSDDATQASSPLSGHKAKRSFDATSPAGKDVSLVDDSTSPGLHDVTPSRTKQQRRSLVKQLPRQETRCDHCSHAPFKDTSSLRKHIAAAHTRPFPCAFSFAGCPSTFGSKNEWKRHIASQHLCLTYYRCTACPQSTADGKGNEFNRKDLFTQHLRRMHAPFAIKKALTKGDSKLQIEWETHVKEMQQSCLVIRRRPPQRSACPKPDCASVFEGPSSWDEWTEHVGRHMEKGEAGRLNVDPLLAKWALDENVIERRGDGEYRLVSGPGSSSPIDGPNGGAIGNAFDKVDRRASEARPELEAHTESSPQPERLKQHNHVGEKDHRDEGDENDRTIVAVSTFTTPMEVDR